MTLQQDREQVLARMLKAAPDGVTTRDVARELGLGNTPAKTVLHKARSAGVVQMVKHGTTYRWIDPANAEALLARLLAGEALVDVDRSALASGFLRGTRRIVAAGIEPPPTTSATRSVWDLGRSAS